MKVAVGTVTNAPVDDRHRRCRGRTHYLGGRDGCGSGDTGHGRDTAASKNVVGTGTNFTTKLVPGQFVTVDADTTPYQIDTIADDTHLALKTAYPTTIPGPGKPLSIVGAAATANKDYSLILTTTNPSTVPAPLPLTIKIFAGNAPVPQSIVGVAAQVQQVVNTALGVALPGAYVLCSASGSGLRLNAYLPGNNIDAVISFGTVATSATLGDAAAILGLTSPTSSNVAHYALGTGHVWGSQTSSTAGGDGTGLPGTAGLIGDQGSSPASMRWTRSICSTSCASRRDTRRPQRPIHGWNSAVDPVAIYSTAISYCDSRRAMLLLDCPPPREEYVFCARLEIFDDRRA